MAIMDSEPRRKRWLSLFISTQSEGTAPEPRGIVEVGAARAHPAWHHPEPMELIGRLPLTRGIGRPRPHRRLTILRIRSTDSWIACRSFIDAGCKRSTRYRAQKAPPTRELKVCETTPGGTASR